MLLNYDGSFCSNIIVYENGKEALENLKFMLKAKKSLPEVIFLDLNMPVIDGWEFLDEFAKLDIPEKIDMYVVGSSLDIRDKEKLKEYDMVINMISKP